MLMSADNKPQTVVLTPKIQIKSHSCNIDDAHITLTLDQQAKYLQINASGIRDWQCTLSQQDPEAQLLMLYGSAQDFYHYLIQPGVMEKFIEGILYFSDTISLLKRTFQISLKEVYNRKKDIARLQQISAQYDERIKNSKETIKVLDQRKEALIAEEKEMNILTEEIISLEKQLNNILTDSIKAKGIKRRYEQNLERLKAHTNELLRKQNQQNQQKSQSQDKNKEDQ